MRLNRLCLIDRQHDSRILHIRIDPASRSHFKLPGLRI